MDTKDAEAWIAPGSAAIARESGGRRKFSALLLTHTLLTGACIAISIYVLQTPSAVAPPPLSNDKGILLNMKKDSKSPLLNFTVTWNQSLELNHGSEVKVQYPGPYIFYICAIVTGENNTKGNLTLKQGETQTSIELTVSSGKRCVRHERLVSLFEDDVVTFMFQKPKGSYLKVLRVGLHYMLGAQHFKTPIEGV